MNEAPRARLLFDRFVTAANAALAKDPAAVESNKALVHRYFEMWNTGDGSLADSVLGPTYLDHAHPEVIGPVAVRSLVPRFRAKNPDARMQITIAAADAEFVAVHNTVTRTVHGRTVISEGVALFRVEAEKLVEQWSSYPDAEAAPSALVPRPTLEEWLAFRA
jgi:predicted SnoaL-like aldol condensation-catalyzing enzyme